MTQGGGGARGLRFDACDGAVKVGTGGRLAALAVRALPAAGPPPGLGETTTAVVSSRVLSPVVATAVDSGGVPNCGGGVPIGGASVRIGAATDTGATCAIAAAGAGT
mmetsp:Transcript_99201/g.212580  ORF Transcript_99201/g.212580 Transcript_99201/m.212580 type:complete len:107 (+) Transcript_99201:485-805(+)